MRVASICLLLAFAQESADPYYKFAKDTAWTYSMTGPDGKAAKMTIKVTGEKDGKVMVEMAQAEKGNESKLAWYVDGGIFYWSEKKGDAYKEAIGMWKVGSKKGDTWNSPGTDLIQKHSGTNLGKEDVKVPAGAYKDAVHVRLDIVEHNDTVKLDVYFVEKVGIVKMAYNMGEMKMSMDLEEFKPVK